EQALTVQGVEARAACEIVPVGEGHHQPLREGDRLLAREERHRLEAGAAETVDEVGRFEPGRGIEKEQPGPRRGIGAYLAGAGDGTQAVRTRPKLDDPGSEFPGHSARLLALRAGDDDKLVARLEGGLKADEQAFDSPSGIEGRDNDRYRGTRGPRLGQRAEGA